MSAFPRLDILPASQRTLWPHLADANRETKDYADVDALLRSGLSLSSGLAGARILFPAFAPQECLKALTYFEDEALRDLPQDQAERLLNAVKNVRSVPTASLASSRLID